MSCRESQVSKWLCAGFGLVLTWQAAASSRAPVIDRMTQQPGTNVATPYSFEGTIETGQCTEFRALELGVDVRITLNVDGSSANGADGRVSRHGLQFLVFCAAESRHFSLRVETTDKTQQGTIRFSSKTWNSASPALFSALKIEAQAFAELNDPSRARDSGQRFAESAAKFDDAHDLEHAAMTWALSSRLAEASLDHSLAARASAAALERAKALAWLRVEVVLLNDRALFVAQEDLSAAQDLIGEAFTLQARLGDPPLAAAIENNVCLLRHEFGDLSAAESCFARLLDQEQHLKMPSASVGAVRNNWALVQLSKGRYRVAATAFSRAAGERLAGGDREGYVGSMGNEALCNYQLGNVGLALTQLHKTYEYAKDNQDTLGRGKIAEYLGAMYLAYGDIDAADAFATEAEGVYRDNHRVADLAQGLRLRARIVADRGNLADALHVIQNAWDLATQNRLPHIAANIASTYADILLRQGDVAATGDFIRLAHASSAQYGEAHSRVSLGIAETRWLRLAGRRAEAAALSSSLLKDTPFPGLSRTKLLIERYLISLQEGTDGFDQRYANLLSDIKSSVVTAPDPELALRLLDIARPAAEATIALALENCADQGACTRKALRIASDYFGLKPHFSGNTAPANDEMRGLLQSLSVLQSRDDKQVASAQLKARVKQLQAAERMQVAKESARCGICDQVWSGGLQVIYFFGDARSWRWDLSGSTWRVRELPPWRTLATHLKALRAPDKHSQTLAALSELTADLGNLAVGELSIGGDDRVTQVPFAALLIGPGQQVADRYAVSITLDGSNVPAVASRNVSFAGVRDDTSGLYNVDDERRVVAEWSRRSQLSLVDSAAPESRDQPLRLLHIATHGQRDIGAGMSVVWLPEQPLISYLYPTKALAATVVINACESGASAEFATSQASIAYGLLQAGANEVVGTLYPVSDKAAAAFAKEFYAVFDASKDNFAQAVRSAQLALRGSRATAAYWPAYVALKSSRRVPSALVPQVTGRNSGWISPPDKARGGSVVGLR